MSSSNCCFLTCIQTSQEAGQVVWYSHLFQNFPPFIVIQTVKGSRLGIINKAEVDFFLELSCFFDDPADVGNLISGSSAFSKISLNIWKFRVHVLLKLAWRIWALLTSVWDECNCAVFSILWHSAFFIVQLSHPYMTTGKTIAFTRWTFVGKVMSLLLNMLSRLVITFLPRSNRLLISWLQWFWSPQNKVSHCFHRFPIDLPWSYGTRCHDLRFLNVEL